MVWDRLLARDNIWLIVGVVVILHEVFLREAERPFILALAGALMGLPFVLDSDRRNGGGNNDKPKR